MPATNSARAAARPTDPATPLSGDAHAETSRDSAGTISRFVDSKQRQAALFMTVDELQAAIADMLDEATDIEGRSEALLELSLGALPSNENTAQTEAGLWALGRSFSGAPERLERIASVFDALVIRTGQAEARVRELEGADHA